MEYILRWQKAAANLVMMTWTLTIRLTTMMATNNRKTQHNQEIEMQTRQHEKSRLPDTSYDEDETTPLLGAQAEIQNSWDTLMALFPKASSIDLETSYSKTNCLQIKKSGFGKKLSPANHE